jgi:hypothetical protein
MRSFFAVAGIVGCVLGSVNCGYAQMTAITSDGKRVILNSDGTWKYEFDNDGKKVVFNPDGTWRYENAGDSVRPAPAPLPPPVSSVASRDSAKAPAKDSVKIVVKPPVVKPPLNLNCSALVAVQRDITSDSFYAESRRIRIVDDKSNGFTVMWTNTKKGPLTWSTTLTSGGFCINEGNKVIIVFKDGRRIQLTHDGKSNCNSTLTLNFGGIWGKEEILDALKSTEINGIRINTSAGSVDGSFSEDDALRFKATINCLAK